MRLHATTKGSPRYIRRMGVEEEQSDGSGDVSPRPFGETAPAQSEETSPDRSGGDDAERWWQDPLLAAAAGAVSVTLATLVGIAIAAWSLNWDGFWRGMGQPYATTLAALAAVSAGAIALHNHRSQLSELRAQRELEQGRWEHQRKQDQAQREVEQSRWEQQREQDQAQRREDNIRLEDQKAREAVKDLRARFSEITTQLADEKATIRRSGVYAMAALANDWRGLGEESEAKVCFGVLAAYLTTPSLTYIDSDKPDAGEDGPVRALIVALLSKNAGPGLSDLWGNSSLLAGADLRGVTITAPSNSVDFSNANLAGATLFNQKFQQGRFMGTILNKADLSWADMQDAQLSFAKLEGANLFRTDLRNARLVFANLQGASLDGTKLSGADFESADLYGADLSNAAELETVNLEGVYYDKDTRWPEGFTPPPR